MNGINLETGSNYCSFIGCVTICDFPGCDEITTKHYIRGEDPEFWDMFEKSRWPKDDWYQDRIFILGFCDSHSSGGTQT